MFTVYFYTNNVDPIQYGVFSKISAISSIVYPLLFAPIWYYILRFGMAEGRAVVQMSFSVFFGVGSVLAIFAMLLFLSSRSEYSAEVVACILTIVAYGNIQIQLENLRVQIKPIHYLILSMVRSMLVLGLSYFFIKYDFYIILSPIVDATIIAIAICVIPSDLKVLSLKSIKNVLPSAVIIYKYGFYLSIYSVFNTALFSIDRVLIAYINDNYYAGLYSSPYDLAMKVVHTLVFALELSMLPALLKVKNSGGSIKNQLISNTETYLFVMLPVVVGLIAIRKELCNIYFPVEYREAADFIFPIIVLSTFIAGFANAIFHHSYLLAEKNKRLFVSIAIVLVFNILANLFVNSLSVPFFSAYVALCTFSIYTIITFINTRNCYGYRFPWAFLFKLLLICCPISVYAFLEDFSTRLPILALEILISILWYVLACTLFNINDFKLKFLRLFHL